MCAASTESAWFQRLGDDATARARDMVEAMRKKGDADGTDVWLRIIVAIGALAELPGAALKALSVAPAPAPIPLTTLARLTDLF